jgi:hypothetical protein
VLPRDQVESFFCEKKVTFFNFSVGSLHGNAKRIFETNFIQVDLTFEKNRMQIG